MSTVAITLDANVSFKSVTGQHLSLYPTKAKLETNNPPEFQINGGSKIIDLNND